VVVVVIVMVVMIVRRADHAPYSADDPAGDASDHAADRRADRAGRMSALGSAALGAPDDALRLQCAGR